jgi:hypothetical protein
MSKRKGTSVLFAAAALALLAGQTAWAQQANYTLPKEPTAQSGSTYYYAVPIGFTWDNFCYVPNGGDWNVGDHGFDAGEIPGNPTFCGPKGDMCPATAGSAASIAFVTTNNDPTHGFNNIPLLIGPTQDGFNNVMIANGQAIPVVPGKYTAVYVTNTQVNGPRHKMLALNYTDGSTVFTLKWGDWCAPSQAAPDFFTWSPTHRLDAGGGDGATCALITKYVPVDPNRTLTSVTIGTDDVNNGGGIDVPGDTVTGTNGRTMIGGITLASTDKTLGGYGFVSGHMVDSTGKVLTTPDHSATGGAGYDVYVVSPALGNYGAGANVDGTYTIGLPAGTYTLAAAVRDGSGPSAGPQAAAVTVTVTAGQTTKQDITLAAGPDPKKWGELKGVVSDSSGKPVTGVAVLFSNSANGPFAAKSSPTMGEPDDGTTQSDGAFDIVGLDATQPIYVQAEGNGFATASAMKVTLTGGGAVTQNLTVGVLQIGNINGTVAAPDGSFGGIGIPVILTGKNLTLTTTTAAEPPLAGTSVVPATGETATFQFTGVPAGDYMLTLPASAIQASAASMPVTVTAGGAISPTLKLTYPAWTEGTPDATISDALTGTSLNAAWTAGDIGTPGAAGSNKPGASGLAVMADGSGYDQSNSTGEDAFYYIHKTIPAAAASGNWVAYVTVSAAPSTGLAGLMVASGFQGYVTRMANFTPSVTGTAGIQSLGRQADGTNTFDFGQTAAGTDPNNSGTQPKAPIILKLRKAGGNFAGFYSADGGKTQQSAGLLAPQFDPAAALWLGIAATSLADGTLETTTFQNFVFAPLPTVNPTPATNPAPAAGQ